MNFFITINRLHLIHNHVVPPGGTLRDDILKNSFKINMKSIIRIAECKCKILALTAAPTIYQNIEFPAKAGIHVHSEIHGPRGQRRGDSVVGTAVKAKIFLSKIIIFEVMMISLRLSLAY
ncbi:MAG: hypothetical protein A3F46_06660 [Legionellales bacterium RIFCSPHIGHO2_12_FULL_42_9]|nr:MAG: hypothetical protein A3F46_06660 [Legionellales bacterium RIFCSPHIGHO2_12_FULL_42_9]